LIHGGNLGINRFTDWIRRTGLDELPQLYNVLLGQMNFIGPRPLMVQELLMMNHEYPYYNKKRKISTPNPASSDSGSYSAAVSSALKICSLSIFFMKRRELLELI